MRYPARCVYVTRFFLRIAYAGPPPARSNGRSNCQRVWVALSITNSLACIPWEAPMTLPPTDPPDPDLDLMLAGVEELSEEELAGLAGPADGELAGLAEPADEALAVLDERLDEELARLSLDPDAARAGTCPEAGHGGPGEAAGLFGGGFAEGGVLDGLGPGPALAGFSQGALDEGLGGLSDDELVGVLRASWRVSGGQAWGQLGAGGGAGPPRGPAPQATGVGPVRGSGAAR